MAVGVALEEVTVTRANPFIPPYAESRTMTVRLPAVLSVTENEWLPWSFPTKEYSDGNKATESSLLNATVPVYPVLVVPPRFKAVAVSVNGVFALIPAGALTWKLGTEEMQPPE